MGQPEVIVIGAGWSGLAAAKTYLQVNPNADLTILDESESVGGVWSRSRVYDGLVVDSPAGLYEFSDMTMISDDCKPFSRLTGQQVSRYLEAYAEKHNLLSRFRPNTSVANISRRGHGWTVTSSSGQDFYCDKLIISTGLASAPKWPGIPNLEDGFQGPIIHSKTLAKDLPRLTSPSIRKVVIIGGCKSAIEAAVACISAGKEVHWVIRSAGGSGPGMMIVTDKTKANIVAVNVTRIFNTLTPSIYATSGFWYHFYHRGRNPLGTRLNRGYWRLASRHVFAGPQYDKSKNGKKIRPDTDSVFWNPNCISIIDINGPFLADLHSGEKLTVHRNSVSTLSRHGVQLSSGLVLPADAIIYATGWTKSPSFVPGALAAELGLPIPLSADTAEWSALHARADARVVKLFPALANPPKPSLDPQLRTPYRLYNHILPPALAARGDRSLAFTGHLITSQTAFFSELSALYAVAYMENLLPKPLPSLVGMKEAIALVNGWMERRYGRKGVEEPLCLCEQSFFDGLCREMGVRVERKKGCRGSRWVWEWFAPYRARDYEGFVEEFLAGVGERAVK
jgi:dimethylaniline monooxygenase (N-oxide forming)